MKKTLHFRHGLAAMTATIVMLFAQLLATNAHTSGISPATAGDETSSYGIDIIGVPVTSENCNDLSVIDGVSGTVKYDPTTKTLTLENATIDAGNKGQGISNQNVPDLNIQVIGTNKVTSHTSAVTIKQTTTISGTGTLNATSTNNCGILINNSALSIENCTVNATGSWGIAGRTGATNETLTIRNAIVTAQGSSGSICDIFKLTLDNVAITSPTGAAYDSSLKGVALNGTVVTDKVVIHPFTCGIEIAGTPVTLDNCNDLSVIEGVSGTVKYDPLTRTLTLKNAKINLSDQPAIYNEDVSDLTIKVIGTGNTITVGYKVGIGFTKPTKIKGYSGSILKITSKIDCGIYMRNSPLTIEDCTVNTKGEYGIAGYNGNDREILTIRSANVVAEGRLGSICDIKDLVLGQGCSISSPAGAAYDSSCKGVALNGTLVTGEVTISVKSYRFNIVGVNITSDNYNRINTIEGVSGTVNYNPATNTLTLENATIQANDENDIAIFSSSPNLTILVTGTNYIKSPRNGLHILDRTTIKGEGTLNIECTNIAINTLAPNLTIEDCTVNAIGNYSISGRINDNNTLNSLTIQNAIVKAESEWGSIVNIRELTLSGSTFTSPATATFNKSKKTVVDNGVTVTNLVIQPTTLYDVVLDWYGVNKIRVIKVLTDKYGYSLSKAKNIVENTPSIAGTGMH
ncbi:MAG: hypothetical protein PUH95_07595, partial [Prevotellaceae bacterium]|nr:hypothetical protein [Prevotellaceae bacterium]